MNRNTRSPASEFAFRLDEHSGVPVYRQLIDQVQGATASGALKPGDQLPTVRQVAVELEINPNTVMRGYREMEIRGIVDTQQGTGTFIADRAGNPSPNERQRLAAQLADELAARAGAAGLTVDDLIDALQKLHQRREQ